MLFSSYEFIFFFLPLNLFIFFQIGRRGYYQLAIAALVAASLFFYAWWNASYLILLLVSILFNYFIGLTLSRSDIYKALPVSRKNLLIFGVVVNLGLLGYFKYANFLVTTSNVFFKTSFKLENISLPLAISFFTFTQIAYLIDIYKKHIQKSEFLNYCLFVTFFPHLIAGPIVHYKEMIPQFKQKTTYQVSYENIAVGLTIFSLGLFKKVVLADSIAIYANAVFNAAAQSEALTLFEAWVGALAYTLQLYFDFSGYSDMAIGAARMFGIKFPLNFNSPYKAVNIIEFWRRWHITLSNFLRDYLYIPLGGNRQGKLRRYLNLMITMLLGGIWHGAGWTFVVWGALHGIYLVINHQWHRFRQVVGHDSSNYWWSQALGCFVTFLAVIVAWVFFRAPNMSAALTMLRAMIGANGVSLPPFLSTRLAFMQNWGVQFDGVMQVTGLRLPFVASWIFVLLFITWFTPNTNQWMVKYEPVAQHQHVADNSLNYWWQQLQWHPTATFGSIVGVLAFVCVKTFLAASSSEFLYFNF